MGSQVFLVIALFTLFTYSLAEVQVTHNFPFIPASQVNLTKCFSSILSVEGCVTQINKSVTTGKFENVGPACCKAFEEVDEKCWPKMFPLNPLFPPLLKNGCSHISATAPTHMKPQLPIIVPGFSLPGSPVDLTKCLSTLATVKGCITEINKSIFTGNFENVGAMCCKAFMVMDAKCWPKVFLLNPLFPHLLKKECSRINRAAPAPTSESSL